MKYYRVPQGLDNRAIVGPGLYCGKITRFLTARELYTEKECIKYGITFDGLELVEISKSRIFWIFGARFEIGNGPVTGVNTL